LTQGQKEEGQNECYLILSEEERAKGFIRPYRDSYIHIGKKVDRGGMIIPLEEVTKDNESWQKLYNNETGYAAYLKYSEDRYPVTGKFLTHSEYKAILEARDYIGGCNSETVMGKALSETYARDPKFYGATFCTGCNKITSLWRNLCGLMMGSR
jgi:hypothetical protein